MGVAQKLAATQENHKLYNTESSLQEYTHKVPAGVQKGIMAIKVLKKILYGQVSMLNLTSLQNSGRELYKNAKRLC